jgi:hypothetical protein
MKRSIVSASLFLIVVATAVWLASNSRTQAQTKKDKPITAEIVTQTSKLGVVETKKPSPAEVIRQKLGEPIGAWDREPMKLFEVLQKLESDYGFPRCVLNISAFKVEAPDAPDPNDIEILLRNVQGLSRAKVLRMILDQIPTNNGAFLVRPTYVEISTTARSMPDAQFVWGNYQNMPLEVILEDFADQTGVTILVDARAADKAKTPITARLQQETNLATAVRLLADMANLKVVIVDRTLYVTSPSNAVDFPPGGLPNVGQKMIDPL